MRHFKQNLNWLYLDVVDKKEILLLLIVSITIDLFVRDRENPRKGVKNEFDCASRCIHKVCPNMYKGHRIKSVSCRSDDADDDEDNNCFTAGR